MKQPNLEFETTTENLADGSENETTSSSALQDGHLEPRNLEVVVYADGACSGNPGPGGWAFILRHLSSGKEIEGSGSEWETTNNRMELQAIIEGLKRLKRRTRVRVVTDSSYVKNGITQWINGWKARNWKRKTSSGLKPVKNVDLWQELDQLTNYHYATFEHVRGHAGHPENERCDELAVAAYRNLVSSS